MLEHARITCPYCWESLDIEVDCSEGAAEYVEDCRICCQPIRIRSEVAGDGELLGVAAEREND